MLPTRSHCHRVRGPPRKVFSGAGSSLQLTGPQAHRALKPNLPTYLAISRMHSALCGSLVDSQSATEHAHQVLLIGATGGTGRSAAQGLLASLHSHQPLKVAALTRNAQSTTAKALQKVAAGITFVEGDLDSAESLEQALQGCDLVYCHALAKDGAKADAAEVTRAQALIEAMKAASPKIKLLVYNGSGGKGCGYGITQMDQKHCIEDMFAASGVPFVALQATLFMEEFWKRFTRPSILKGTFPFSVPPNRKVQLLAAHDLGRVAATCLQSPELYAGHAIELAGDELTPTEMCQAFSRAQGGQEVKQSCPPAWLFWFVSRDVWRIVRFLTNVGYKADLAMCREKFPGLLTFDQFLAKSQWGDETRTFEQGFDFNETSPESERAAVEAKAAAALVAVAEKKVPAPF